MDNLGYQNRLEYSGRKSIEFADDFKKYNNDQIVYVYIKTFPNDKILTGQYYQNWGVLYGDKRDEWLTSKQEDERKVELYGGQEVWTIVFMTLGEFKEFLNKDKEQQDILDNTYPYIINGGKYGNVWFESQIKDKSYLHAIN